jgi:hypothetical protein
MMGEIDGHASWNEPLIGLLFGEFYGRFAASHAKARPHDFVFGDDHRAQWAKLTSEYVLALARERFPGTDRVTIKEPNGSVGASFLSAAMPESGFVLLVRDPRDAVASSLASHQKGGWLYEWNDEGNRRAWQGAPDEDPDRFVKGRANYYRTNVERAAAAHDAHRGPKAILRYEDLLANTEEAMRRLYSALRVRVGEEEVVRAVEKHSWRNIPLEERGEGKFNRRGEVGAWRDELTVQQARVVERKNAWLMQRFGYMISA